MKFVQPAWETFFFENSYTKCDEDTIPRPFFKKKKIKIKHISESVYYSFIQLVFIVCQVDDYQNILKLSCRPLAFTTYKAFLKKQKEVWN